MSTNQTELIEDKTRAVLNNVWASIGAIDKNLERIDRTIEEIKGIKIRQFKDYSMETESKNKE
jgi:hypothetical protein